MVNRDLTNNFLIKEVCVELLYRDITYYYVDIIITVMGLCYFFNISFICLKILKDMKQQTEKLPHNSELYVERMTNTGEESVYMNIAYNAVYI